MATLVVAVVVALLGYRFARVLVPDVVARPVGRLVVWVAAPALYALLIAFGPPEVHAALLTLSFVAGLGFFIAERRRATAAERDADRKARDQALRQQRKRLPPPAPPPTTRTTP